MQPSLIAALPEVPDEYSERNLDEGHLFRYAFKITTVVDSFIDVIHIALNLCNVFADRF